MGIKSLTSCVIPLAFFYSSSLYALTLNVDVNDAGCSDVDGTPYCDVRRAVEDASSGDTINLASGVYTGTVLINKHLTIIGAGADTTFIDGGAFGRRAIRVFTIPVDSTSPSITTVSISGVTLQKGRDVQDGGGVLNGGDLVLTDCVVTDNTSDTSGGGIYSSGSVSTKLVIDNCIISNNASEAIGSISDPANNGGGGIYSLGTLEIYNSQILSNSANDHAGGIFVASTNFASTAYIEDSYFYNNTGKYDGAIYNNGNIAIKRSAFESNRGTTDSVGGAISNEFIGNLYVTNSTFTGNRSTLRGGAIYHNGTGDAYIYSSTIANNATGIDYGQGGGIFYSSGGNVYIKNTLLADNTAKPSGGSDCGGAIISEGYNLISNADDCIITATTGDLFGTQAQVIDAKLDAFADNGGPTKTHALIDGSPAIDAGDVNGCIDIDLSPLTIDQRYYPRPDIGGTTCDIGAFEGSVAAPAPAPAPAIPVDDGTTDGTNTTDATSSGSGGGALSLFMLMLLPLVRLVRAKLN